MNDPKTAGGWWTAAQRAAADAAYLGDLAKWGAFRLANVSRLLLEAFERGSDAEKKDIGAAVVLNHVEALDSYASLCHGVRTRGSGPVLQAVMYSRRDDCRSLFRWVRSHPEETFLEVLQIDPRKTRAPVVPRAAAGDLDVFCEKRQEVLAVLAASAHQSLLFQISEPESWRPLILSSAAAVAEIKMGSPSDMGADGNSAFLLLDASADPVTARPDLIATAAPTGLNVLQGIVAEIELIAAETSLIAAFAGELAASGSLYDPGPASPP